MGFHYHFPLRIIVTTLITVGWFLFMETSVVNSLCNDGFTPFVRHFTNWSWVIQMTFFYILISGLFSWDELFEVSTLYLLLPSWGVSWIVFVLVLVLELKDGNFVLNSVIFYKSGEVFFGNALFHFIPPLIYTIIIIGWLPEIKLVFMDNSTDEWGFWIYSVVSPLVPMAIYSLIFDFQDVYKTNLPFYQGFIISLIVSLVTNTITIWCLTKYGSDRTVMYTKKKINKHQQIENTTN